MLNHLNYNKSFDQLSYDEKTLLEEAKKSIEEFVEQSAEISDVTMPREMYTLKLMLY